MMHGTESQSFRLWCRRSWPNVSVAGEIYHQDQIREILGAGLNNSQEYTGTALLVPEPTNSHDPFAVQVLVEGHRIGYLPAELASVYQPVLARIVGEGLTPTTDCRIWAWERDEWTGTDRRGRDVYEASIHADASVCLDSPCLLVPVNTAPGEPHRMLPDGSAIQVRGEEKHLEVLAPLVGDDGEAWAHVTLEAKPDATKPTLEISIDGATIGELTPTMSAKFLPAVEHLATEGELTAAKALLRGNSVKVEATLYAAKAHELPPAWFSTTPSPAPDTSSSPTLTTGHARYRSEELLGSTAETFEVPPKPTAIRFNAPPGWPAPPGMWEPWSGWRPQSDWPVPPKDWQFWVPDTT